MSLDIRRFSAYFLCILQDTDCFHTGHLPFKPWKSTGERCTQRSMYCLVLKHCMAWDLTG